MTFHSRHFLRKFGKYMESFLSTLEKNTIFEHIERKIAEINPQESIAVEK